MLRYNKKYFNVDYFRKLVKLMEGNRFEEALAGFHKYIENYPQDLDGYTYCANCYMCLGDFESAEKLLNKAVFSDKTDEEAKEQFILFKINLLCYQEKYSECLNVLKENISIFKKNGWGYTSLLLYLKKKLNILKEHDYAKADGKYLLSQIVSYSEEEAISHIERHKDFDGNDNLFKFTEDFPIKDVYYKLRNGLLLENKNKIYNGMFANHHIFKYDSNGHVGTKLVDYFMVITTKDTNDIITMCPYENNERRECIDLTPVLKKLPKQKRLSQIEKFNQRYSKN